MFRRIHPSYLTLLRNVEGRARRFRFEPAGYGIIWYDKVGMIW